MTALSAFFPSAVGMLFRLKVGLSKIGPSTNTPAIITFTLSLRQEIPNGCNLPFGFGMYTRLTASGRYFPSFSCCASSPSHVLPTVRFNVVERFSPSTPAAPLLARQRW